LPAIIQEIRLAFVDQIVESVLVHRTASISHGSQWLAALTTHPVWGLIVLAMVLFGMYQFVGVFGAGTLVGLLEEGLFGQVLNPWVVQTVERIIPWQLAVDFLVGEYGVWTMGFTYAAALLLPIVSTFFFTFGVLEDSGYLPRLSILSNRLFTKLGLNGKAVLPMVLGLGCVTMATLTTRILDNKRDRMLVTLLLALAIPCSAQLGVVMGMLAGISFGAVIIWSGVMAAILFTVGWLAARLMPGERTPLLVELPPLRWPVLSNVLLKTLVRLEWYIKEAVPLFFLGTILLFTLDKLNVLPWIIKASEPLVVNWLGLPPETSAAFLIGFLRRDFAATGLFAMQSAGALTPLQVVVAIVTITLFIPCIASVFVIAKERGARSAIAMTALIFPLAFLTGGLLQRLLVWRGWGL
jgi:ferrous iron transport protein B